jgi:pyruvate dehydrogenase (quinone)
MSQAISSYPVEERILDGGMAWVAIRVRGAEWSWLTPAEAAHLGRQWAERYGSQQLGLPVKVVAFNNSAPGFVELEQTSTEFLNFGTELSNPNFAAMAAAVGIRGIRLEEPSEVADGIARAIAHDGPVVVDAVVNRTDLAMPPLITVEMAFGFSLYMAKTIMNGRADEIVDLAKTNLWR